MLEFFGTVRISSNERLISMMISSSQEGRFGLCTRWDVEIEQVVMLRFNGGMIVIHTGDTAMASNGLTLSDKATLNP